MKDWLRRLKGLAVVGATGAAVGALFGSAWFALSALLGTTSANLGTWVWVAGLWGAIGGVAAGGVGLLLTALDRGQTAAELSIGRTAFYGAVTGALVPLVIVALALLATGETSTAGILQFVSIGSGLGAATGAGVSASARHAARRELGTGDDPLGSLGSGQVGPQA